MQNQQKNCVEFPKFPCIIFRALRYDPQRAGKGVTKQTDFCGFLYVLKKKLVRIVEEQQTEGLKQ